MNKRVELIIFAVAAVLVVVAAYLLVVSPQAGKASAASAKEQTALLAAQTAQNNIKALQAIKDNAGPLTRRAEALGKLFPSTPALPDLLNAVNQASTLSGVDLSAVTPSTPVPTVPASALAKISVNVSVTGGYFAVEDFLFRLEDLGKLPAAGATTPPRAMIVESATMAPSGAAGGGSTSSSGAPTTATAVGQLTVAIAFSAFQSTPLAAAPAPVTP